MKELILIRHAKSDWGNEYLKDIDRHLNARGYGDAYMLSKWYFENHLAPERILSSTATRALNTALIFARALNFNMANFLIEESIYESSVSNLLSTIKKQPDTLKSMMLFGHNPSITNLYNELCTDMFIDNVPTCGIIKINFDTKSWKDINEKNAKLNFFQFPKDYKNTN
ncbi:MAG: histidine phosphatase family protein [Bacteroidota bacterium]|nr:histidine phosphatase family protein [Bacteroidota bacterium]MDP3144166.1 histidine phosphatase family protein [Bacteroidota bacterium]